jgi:hypothetical protein
MKCTLDEDIGTGGADIALLSVSGTLLPRLLFAQNTELLIPRILRRSHFQNQLDIGSGKQGFCLVQLIE